MANLLDKIEKYIFQGDNRTFELTVTDQDDTVVDITSYTIVFTVKEKATDLTAKITKTTADVAEINITDPTNGIAEIYLVPADTSSLAAGVYVFDIQVTDTSSKIYTLMTGSFIIKQDVT